MLAVSVFLKFRSAGNDWAPQYANPGRGSYPTYGHWGSSAPASGTPLGPAVPVPRRPRDRMGFRGSARSHARHQRQWHVHRSARSAVGGSRLFRAIESRPALAAQLHGAAHRTRRRHGRGCFTHRIGKPETLSGIAFVTHSTGRLIPPYTRAAPCGAGAARGRE